MESISLIEFPTTRYQGSKRKILPWIYSAIKDLEFETVLDAFGGSASVSYLFKKMNKSVTYNDKLNFNHIIGQAIIENNRIKLNHQDLLNLLDIQTEEDNSSFIQNHFKDIYYLDEENRWLDNVVSNIVNMNHYQGKTLQFKKSLAFYALFQASLIKRPFNLFHRKNLNIRNADVVRGFGNKVTWDRSFEEYLVKFTSEANKLVFNSGKKCHSMNQSAFDIDSYGYDLVYLDPPYFRKDGSNESSNYLNCYHFLEGLSRYPEWKELIDYESVTLRFKQTVDNSEFKIGNVGEIFEKLITKYKDSKIVLSYKQGGVPSIEFLENLIRKVKGNVHTVSKHYIYALNHQNGDAQNNREVLIIGI